MEEAESKLARIDAKLDKIEMILKTMQLDMKDVKQSGTNMDRHISFVERILNPFQFLRLNPYQRLKS